jgi:hypothetical protein
MPLLVHNILSFSIAYLLMSFFEYATHRWMLHRNTVVRVFPREFVKRRLNDHAVSHHSHYYKCFRREDDPHGKHVGMFIPLSFYIYITLVVGSLLLAVDWITAAYFVAFIVAHYFVWNKFHELMHFYTTPWYIKLPIVGWWYHLVEYYHFLHHQHRDKNFNAFLPIWDFLLGTLARETELDRAVWKGVNAGEFIDRRGMPLPELASPYHAFLPKGG